MTDQVLRGLVLRTADYKESSKMLTVLTDALGKLSVSARGATRARSRIAAACQPFAYSELTVSENRDRYYLKEAVTLELFDGLAADLSAYALGSYFLELLDAACPEDAPEPEALALGLNALWLLADGKKPQLLVKSAFELRLLSVLGFRPELVGCSGCDAAEPEAPMLDLRGGALYCRDCALKLALRPVSLGEGVLPAMRHILDVEPNRVFAFSLSERALRRLNEVAEAYTAEQLERSFRTLDYYKSIR